MHLSKLGTEVNISLKLQNSMVTNCCRGCKDTVSKNECMSKLGTDVNISLKLQNSMVTIAAEDARTQ